MCSNKTTPSMNTKRRPRAKKSRTKAKKQKFLSLRLQFPADDQKRCDSKTKQLSEMRPDSNADVGSETHHHQLDLNQVEDRESHDHENDVAYFFAAADGGDTSLTGLLDASAATESNSSHATNIGSRVDDLSHSSASLPYAYGGQDSESGAALVRNALRNRERDSSEEKWVCYSEVVERRVKEEEVTSSAVDLRQDGRDPAVIRRLSLKLDYQEILNAWSDKGPLYIHGDSSRIVPDVNYDLFSHEASNNGVSWGCNGGLWTVPEMVGDIENGDEIMRLKNEEEELKIGRREASVLRYKEKRQNRLFSKKVRYEVRKLNAEKRPRVKGRFVKRS